MYVMAMTLRLTDDETADLRACAEREGRSMQDVAREAVRTYVAGRSRRLNDIVEHIVAEDAELLRRLAQ